MLIIGPPLRLPIRSIFVSDLCRFSCREFPSIELAHSNAHTAQHPRESSDCPSHREDRHPSPSPPHPPPCSTPSSIHRTSIKHRIGRPSPSSPSSGIAPPTTRRPSEGPPPLGRPPHLHFSLRRNWLLRLLYPFTEAFCDADKADAYLSRHPPNTQLSPDPNKKTLVLLGSGWGSTSLLKGLNTEDYNVIVVSPRNYFLFTRKIPSLECALTGSVVTFDYDRIG